MPQKVTSILILALSVALIAQSKPVKDAAKKSSGPTKVFGKPVTMPSGLQYWDIKRGTGPVAGTGKQVKVNYTGWLLNGKEFDSSEKAGRPFSFLLGTGEVIKGWDQGLVGMSVGGKRQLRIPPNLAYGDRGAGADIPPNSTLIFDVELVDMK